jgi:outer membrane protein assembly factor BamB
VGEAPRKSLTAIDVKTGGNLWAREFEGGVASVGTGPLGLYVYTHGDGLHKLDSATGETIWMSDAGESPGLSIAPYSGTNALIVVNGNGGVKSIDPATGALIWQVDTGLPAHSFSIAEGTLPTGEQAVIIRAPEQLEGEQFHEEKTMMTAIALESGDVLWSQTLNDPSKGDMQIANGLIYTTTSLVRYDITNDAGERIDTGFRNWLVAIDLETGDEVWSIESDPSWGMAFELTDDTLIMYRSFGAFVAVDLATGKITCDAFMPSGASSDDDHRSPDAGAYDGEMLYLSLKNGDVMAVHPGDWSC